MIMFLITFFFTTANYNTSDWKMITFICLDSFGAKYYTNIQIMTQVTIMANVRQQE